MSKNLEEKVLEGTLKIRKLIEENATNYKSSIRLSVRNDQNANLANKLGINLFYYCQGNPINYVCVLNSEKKFVLSTKKNILQLCKKENKSYKIVKETNTDLEYVVLTN